MLLATASQYGRLFWLLPADIADVIRKALGVDTRVLPGVAFTDTGITFAWQMQGTTPNQLAYTVRCWLLKMACKFALSETSMHDMELRFLGHMLMLHSTFLQAWTELAEPTQRI
jgi:hypothetical protein